MNDIPSPLSSDRPSTDPGQDLFGHAPFARTLAKAIQSYRSSDGIVLALYGPWGSGKSTVLAYVQHELDHAPEEERPVIVSFNPWWFSGQEHLAKAFLGQMQAVLPAKYEGFKKVGDLLSDFSSALGSVAELVSPFAGKVAEVAAQKMATKPKDVPALKKALADLLLEKKKRVLVVIDDIDRLAPDEVRQLFTVIKALADFPYLTYLLAFDRNVAATAISEQTGLPGDRYLEKIIQVPFELPRVDRTTLFKALSTRLDAVMAATPEGRFDHDHWSSVFNAGLRHFFHVPRDVVRLTNVLSVTYSAVVGEVNPVDFIAIECLRVFLPSVYDAIRTTPDQFCGYKAIGDRDDKQWAIAFHEVWLSQVPEELRQPTKDLVIRLFPRLESVWSNMHYSADSFYSWRRHLRVCVPDVFPAYFRLSLPDGAVSRAEVDALLQQSRDSLAFAAALRSAAAQKTTDGSSKVRAVLERFMDHVPEDLDATHSEPIITAFLDVGDEFLKIEKPQGLFDRGNETRVGRIVYHMLKKVPEEQRTQLLLTALNAGAALRCGQYVFATLSEEAEKAEKGEGDALLSLVDAAMLKNAWCSKVHEQAAAPAFIDHPDLAILLSSWRHWGGEDHVKSWWQEVAKSDAVLLQLVAAHASEARSQTVGEYAVRVKLRVNPKSISHYDDPVLLSSRVQALLFAGSVPDRFARAAIQFVRGVERMKNGKDPDAIDFYDD
ncbi:MAG: AAA family ATPase [Rhizobacter sp.]